MLDIDSFRVNFSEFSDDAVYPNELLKFQFEIAHCYIKNLSNDLCTMYAKFIMLAHLLTIRNLIMQGQTVIQINKLANEGDVSVSLLEPPSSTNFYYWLNTSIYGMQLLAFLEVESTGGFYIGGSAERDPFRKVGGGF